MDSNTQVLKEVSLKKMKLYISQKPCTVWQHFQSTYSHCSHSSTAPLVRSGWGGLVKTLPAIIFSHRDQTCISCIGKWILYYYCHLGSSTWICALYTQHIHKHTHTHTDTLHTLFHYGLLQDIEYSSLRYTLGPCGLPTLYIIVCITPFQNRISEKVI